MTKQCIICGNVFHTYPSEFERRETCSSVCGNISKSRKTKGRPKSAEHKRKIAIAHLGKKRPPFSKEWIENLSKAHTGIIKTPEWRAKIGAAHKGEKGSNWQGGKTAKRKAMSFKWFKYPGHPHANGTGFIRMHRHVMEIHLGRFLESHEVVHHINGDPTDDRIENLMLFNSQREHSKFHSLQHQ
jgi:hypothetical protein